MTQLTVLGAGRIGRCIATLLSRRDGFEVTLGDVDPSALEGIEPQLKTRVIDVRQTNQLEAALTGQDVVISACQFFDNPGIATAALHSGTSYFDLTEDVATTEAVRRLSQDARDGQVFVPQCGLAPGYVGILGAEIASRFDTLDTLKLRVGALPEMPSNRMLYNLTWSTEGLVNEYCNPCDAIKNGQRCKILALEGLETFSLGGATYEAFNTSGGLGTLCESLEGNVRDLTYKTVRYPGHCSLMDFLINGLRLGEEGKRRQLLQQILEDAVPVTNQDVVIILVSGTGHIAGKLVQITEHHRISHGMVPDADWSAIQIATAFSASVAVDLHVSGKLVEHPRGFVGQEEIDYGAFMESEWALPYRMTASLYGPKGAG